MTTEHWTDELRNIYAVNFANGILRRTFGNEKLARQTSGPSFWAKAGLAAAMKVSGLQAKKQRKRLIDFAVDPAARDGIRDIPAYAFGR
jgi:hypothetical protein